VARTVDSPTDEKKGNIIMPHILLVDDEEIVRRLLRRTLERDGYDVEEAVNGRQALALYEEQPADLVITDVAMPEMNGFDLIEALTRRFPDSKVIAMSGLAENLSIAKLLGACEAVRKPVDIDELLRMVKAELAGPLRTPTVE
jgi:CheY-like chemotaxis protein